MLNEGDKAPNVTLLLSDGTSTTIDDQAGHGLVLYFYPKDDTTGCTAEAQAFTELADAFAAIDVAVIGVSKDSLKKHLKFIEKYGLKVQLAADEGEVCDAYGTWVEKSMYGRAYMGIERATFLIAKSGQIAKIWRKVKVPGHAAAVLEAAKALG